MKIEEFLQGILLGFQEQDYENIHNSLNFFDEQSPTCLLIKESTLERSWDSIIERTCAQKAPLLQNIFDSTYEIDDLLTDFLKSYLNASRLYFRENYKEALESFVLCFRDFARLYKVLSMQYRNDWLYQLFNLFCYNIRELALMANEQERVLSGENRENLEQALGVISSTKQDMNRLKSNDALTHKLKLLCLIETHLDWINFKLKNFKAVKDGIRSLAELIKNSNFFLSQLAMSNRIQLCFNWGKVALLTGRIPIAVEKLEDALRLCPVDYEKNIRLILRYLSIAKVLNGQRLNKKIMEKYKLNTYYQLSLKVSNGDLRGYYWEMNFRLLKWIKAGMVLLFDSFRSIIYRNMLRKWHKLTGKTKITFAEVKKVFELQKNASWFPEYSEDDIQVILSNLITNGYMKGYISINNQFAVLSQKNPFPKLRDVNVEIQDTTQKFFNEYM